MQGATAESCNVAAAEASSPAALRLDAWQQLHNSNGSGSAAVTAAQGPTPEPEAGAAAGSEERASSDEEGEPDHDPAALRLERDKKVATIGLIRQLSTRRAGCHLRVSSIRRIWAISSCRAFGRAHMACGGAPSTPAAPEPI